MRKWLDFLWCGAKNSWRFHSIWLSAAFSRMIHSEFFPRGGNLVGESFPALTPPFSEWMTPAWRLDLIQVWVVDFYIYQWKPDFVVTFSKERVPFMAVEVPSLPPDFRDTRTASNTQIKLCFCLQDLSLYHWCQLKAFCSFTSYKICHRCQGSGVLTMFLHIPHPHAVLCTF